MHLVQKRLENGFLLSEEQNDQNSHSMPFPQIFLSDPVDFWIFSRAWEDGAGFLGNGAGHRANGLVAKSKHRLIDRFPCVLN